jgi:acyl-CoA thioesterase
MSPAEVVSLMLKQDAFSSWMGIEIVSLDLGSCVLKCIVNETMLNGFYIAHGGITYSLADSALAFASNSYGNKCVSVETSISHTKKVVAHDELIATCHEISRSKKIGIYEVKVLNQNKELVAFFKGIVSISSETW